MTTKADGNSFGTSILFLSAKCVGFVVVCLGTFSWSARPVHADEKSDVSKLEMSLEHFGLKRSGPNLVLEDESALKKCLETEKQLKRELKTKFPVYAAAEKKDKMRTASIPLAYQRRREINRLLAPGNLPVQQHNQLVAEYNDLALHIDEIESDKQWPEQLKAVRADFVSSQEKYIENLLNARKIANKLEDKWSELSSDKELIEIAEQFSKLLKQKVNAGPSKALDGMLRELKKLEESILSDVLPLRNDGSNTFSINVTVNSKESIEMIVDSGASIISLPALAAKELGLEVSGDDPDVQLVLADGRPVIAKKIIIPVVRVGRFEATEVEAAVLPPELINAQPLLGMSFLKNFQFKIDSNAKTLTLVKLGMQEETKRAKSSTKKSKNP